MKLYRQKPLTVEVEDFTEAEDAGFLFVRYGDGRVDYLYPREFEARFEPVLSQ